MAEQLSLSPNGRRVLWGNTNITLIDLNDLGQEVSRRIIVANGRAPRWATNDTFVYALHEGSALMICWEPNWDQHTLRVGGYSVYSTVSSLWGACRPNAMYGESIDWWNGSTTPRAGDPAVNEVGDRAWRTHDLGHLYVNDALYDPRPCSEPRWDGTFLVYRAQDRFICTDRSARQPVNVEPQEFSPVPLLRGTGERWVLSNGHDRTLLRPEGSHLGYVVATGGDQFNVDARFVDINRTLVVWSTNHGVFRSRMIDVRDARVDLRSTAPPPPPPPPPPGDDMKIKVTYFDVTGRVGQPARIEFELSSDVPVVECRVDFAGDGRAGLVLTSSGTDEEHDLRRLRGVALAPMVVGKHTWEISATDKFGATDKTGQSRRIEVT